MIDYAEVGAEALNGRVEVDFTPMHVWAEYRDAVAVGLEEGEGPMDGFLRLGNGRKTQVSLGF